MIKLLVLIFSHSKNKIRGERGNVTQWVTVRTPILEPQEVANSSTSHLHCSGGFQKLVPVVDYTSEKPRPFNVRVFVLLICIIRRPEIKISSKSTTGFVS
jgi:hypothetical protein